MPNAEQLNTNLFNQFNKILKTEKFNQTDHFFDRFENTYIDEKNIPEISDIKKAVIQRASYLLGTDVAKLKCGFWFNAMNSGQKTSLHHHDENDELLSCVYYIRIPKNSGDLILHENQTITTVHPKEGLLVMFSPNIPHEVTPNNSDDMRLAVAFNIGPVDND